MHLHRHGYLQKCAMNNIFMYYHTICFYVYAVLSLYCFLSPKTSLIHVVKQTAIGNAILNMKAVSKSLKPIFCGIVSKEGNLNTHSFEKFNSTVFAVVFFLAFVFENLHTSRLV